MHTSIVKRKLQTDEVLICVKANLNDPAVVELFGYLGFDCIWLDMEHTPINWQSIANQIRAAKMTGMDSMVRIAKGCYSDFIRPLEADATGLMVPHIMSQEELKAVVRSVWFHPKGLRPMDSGNYDGPFCMQPIDQYIKYCNEQKFLLIQIEDREAVDAMEEIVTIDGVDVFFIGPADLSHSYGAPGDFSHPDVRKAIQKLADLCEKYGRNWGIPASLKTSAEYREMGARFLTIGSDVSSLRESFKSVREALMEQNFSLRESLY